MPNIGPAELIIILIIALIVLGPGKLPEVAQSLGKSVREFRKAATDISESASLEAAKTAAAPQPTTTPAQPNALSGESAPDTLQGSPASPVSGDGDATPPAA
ncbi:MAG TPA: twin-arginine translocase TatA/TatE family subunit [Candidatus Limnocylindrales bacterium]|nr:twin-arginine translocase TatA/TatE family subunit [Candidatus Limnocylindrales bacterium]